MRRISDRVLAIQTAEQGADFLEVYRFFLGRGYDEAAAFDGARRVFRGGLLEGGAPFTKDVCYLDGLLRVTNFLRIALTRGQSGLARQLFAGKLAVEDVPLFDRLLREGLAIEAHYVADLGQRPLLPDRPDGLRRVPQRERPRCGTPPLRRRAGARPGPDE